MNPRLHSRDEGTTTLPRIDDVIKLLLIISTSGLTAGVSQT